MHYGNVTSKIFARASEAAAQTQKQITTSPPCEDSDLRKDYTDYTDDYD